MDVRPTSDKEVAGSTPPGRQHSYVEIEHENNLYGHSLPSADLRRKVVNSGERMCTILVNSLRGLSQSLKIVVR